MIHFLITFSTFMLSIPKKEYTKVSVASNFETTDYAINI
jgi:hypothetical protein